MQNRKVYEIWSAGFLHFMVSKAPHYEGQAYHEMLSAVAGMLPSPDPAENLPINLFGSEFGGGIPDQVYDLAESAE